MRSLFFIGKVIFSVFLSSSNPQLFGSRKRRKEKEKLADQMRADAALVQKDIDRAEAANPFESASAKSAMAQSARKAKQVQQRYANMMGANASPEAIISAQQATQEAVSGTAGDIAVGSEALKSQKISQLRGEKMGMTGQANQAQMASINEIGTGWKDFFGAVSQIGQAAEGVAGGASAIGNLF